MTTRSTIMMIIICDKSLPTLIWTTLSELTTNPSLLKSLESSPACERGLPELAATISDSNTTCRKVLRLSKRLWKKNRNLTDLENKSKIVSLSVHLSLSLFVGSIIILEVSSVRPQWTWRSLSNSFLLLFTSTYVCPSFLFSPVYSFVCSFLCWLSRLLLYTRPSTHAFVLVGFSVYSLIR